MVQSSHLPLYAQTYEFIKLLYRLVRQFRKEYKYSLGEELVKIIWEILDEIVITNSLPDIEKRKGIETISRQFDRFKIRFRLAYEIGQIKEKKFAEAQLALAEIGRQIGGWQRWAD